MAVKPQDLMNTADRALAVRIKQNPGLIVDLAKSLRSQRIERLEEAYLRTRSVTREDLSVRVNVTKIFDEQATERRTVTGRRRK